MTGGLRLIAQGLQGALRYALRRVAPRREINFVLILREGGATAEATDLPAADARGAALGWLEDAQERAAFDSAARDNQRGTPPGAWPAPGVYEPATTGHIRRERKP